MTRDEVTAVAINGRILHAHSRAKAEQWVATAHTHGWPAHIPDDPPPDPALAERRGVNAQRWGAH